MKVIVHHIIVKMTAIYQITQADPFDNETYNLVTAHIGQPWHLHLPWQKLFTPVPRWGVSRILQEAYLIS